MGVMRPIVLFSSALFISFALACGSDDDVATDLWVESTGTVDFLDVVTPPAKTTVPIFDGEVNGFRFYDFDGASKDVEFPNIWCNAAREEPVELFRLDYIPPSVPIPSNYSADDQTMRFCVDGSRAFATQRYAAGPGSWTVAYSFLEKAIPSLWTTDRVRAATVQGKPAVVVAPATPDGSGTSIVAFDFGDGWVAIEATDMPLDEVLKIAEGVRLVCNGC
jgi:hypothetical protein